MHIDKEEVVALLRTRGEHDRAQQVSSALPRHVDTEEDAGLLHAFDVSAADLTAVPDKPGD